VFDVSDIGQPHSRRSVVIDGASSYSETEWDRHAFTKQNAGTASLLTAGVVAPPVTSESEIYDSSSRSFIHGDTVYYVRNGKVWSSSRFAPSQLQGPF